MAHLTLAGVSADGARLLLVDDRGAEFTLDITPGLRAALRGDASRLGQLEITMDSTLRPRDIQARIRSGESAESVATAAQTTLERIMPFAGPVLAEREHVAGRAQLSSVRRRSGESAGGARTLGEAVSAHLRAHGVDPATVEWDSWRREDGRWSLRGLYSAAERSGSAEFTFDLRGNYVLLDNDDARWLVGEGPRTVPTPAGAADDLSQARDRRRTGLAPVPSSASPLGDDAIELVSDTAVDDLDDLAGGAPIEAFLDTAPVAGEQERREDAADAAAADAPVADDEPDRATSSDGADAQQDDQSDDQPDPEPDPQPAETPARRTVAKKRGRASVPSWDEIMFGGGDQ